MATIALFHSVLGMRPGMLDAASRLRVDGHDVLAVDQYDGHSFADYDEAAEFVERRGGYPRLMSDAVEAVRDLPDGFVAMGFSNGGGMAEYVATRRRVAGVIMCSGAMPLQMIGVDTWPTGVPAQVHYTAADPFRQEGWAESFVGSVQAAGAEGTLFEYPGSGHLFTDPSLTTEYDRASSELCWQRVLAFCASTSGQAVRPH
jgi:dienelactone hydrolase